ncbi:phosphatase PAP2 family protein [Williamsia sp. CHRR-6]|uniref:phosphatase PAP2 family protein n=1 Tax=Williamsia sp. CHRR-6 TaxID=2835871 RepID=UPI0027DE6E24|nr:phosphatase PAP2 family protein [Williamsia sp. CHRR-6]
MESVAVPPRRFLGLEAKHWRRIALSVWFVAVVYKVSTDGISFDRGGLILLMCLGLAAASIGRRNVFTVILDWLPFVLVLMLYDFVRRYAEWLGMPTQWHLGPDVDKWLFGTNPTVWLQSHLKEAKPPFWEIITSSVYISYFLLPYITAGLLWLRDRTAWRRFAAAFVATSFLALIGFTLLPAAPPWAAARCTSVEIADGPREAPCMFGNPPPSGGLLGPVEPTHAGAAPFVERISARGWDKLGFKTASSMLQVGQSKANLVAAIPSLHAGLTMLVALFMWPRLRWYGRTAFMAYAFTMAFTLVYTAEHYVLDILIGWALAASVIATQRWWVRRNDRRREAAEAAESAQTPAVDLGKRVAVSD